MAKFIVRAIFAAIGLWLSSVLVAGVAFTDMGSLILAAVLLGLVNAVLRPILFILTLPLTLVTLGLFLLVLNAGMIILVSVFLDGFTVDGLWPGLVAAIVTGLTSWLGHLIIRDDKGR
ncbi:MAG: phage holin family protein [Phenylobacterium sp.]|nr:phage holin family protein [Phenylobacterium sp.]MDP2213546.1 phage holin family protein [Phenylobacterium sp.]